MQDLYLIKISADYLDQIKEYRSEFIINDSSMDGCGTLKKFEDPKDYIEEMKNTKKRKHYQKAW